MRHFTMGVDPAKPGEDKTVIGFSDVETSCPLCNQSMSPPTNKDCQNCRRAMEAIEKAKTSGSSVTAEGVFVHINPKR